ncbi:MAG: dihydrofolate reductase, partial [Leucobacter sp.]
MPLARVHNLAISLDGFGAGSDQRLESPFGHAGTRLMEWFFPTATFQGLSGDRERQAVDPATEPDDRFARLSFEGVGAEIMGAG